jgi:hypothetical protein
MGSKISNTEWGLVIGAVLMVEIMQVVLNLLFIGPFINSSITLFTQSTLALYYRIRGVKINKSKLASMIGTSLIELIPVIDMLPAMTMGVIMTMVWDNRDKKKARESA